MTDETTAHSAVPLSSAGSRNAAHAHACVCDPAENAGPTDDSSVPPYVSAGQGDAANAVLLTDLLPDLADGIRRVAADHSLGGAVNALDDLAKVHGDGFPAVALDAAVALARMLDAVHLGTGADPMAADVWRATT